MNTRSRRSILRSARAPLFALAGAALLSACNVPPPRIPYVKPYRMDIQQGNFVSQEMVSQLKPGMTKDQVRFILGTPLLTDIFHADRWDYLYWREDPSGKRERRQLAVYFEDGKLTRLDGDVKPAEAPRAEPKPEPSKPAAAENIAPPAKPATSESSPQPARPRGGPRSQLL